MIALFAQNPDIHAFFRGQGTQILFRWLVFTKDTKFESEWQSLSAAQRVDRNLIGEFSARFSHWHAIIDKFGLEASSYLELAKKAALSEQPPEVPARWLPIHRAWVPYAGAQSAMLEQLQLSHPAGEFCTIRRVGMVDDPVYYALCRKAVWSSSEWLEPKRWLQNAEQILGTGNILQPVRKLQKEPFRLTFVEKSGDAIWDDVLSVGVRNALNSTTSYRSPVVDQIPSETFDSCVSPAIAGRQLRFENE